MDTEENQAREQPTAQVKAEAVLQRRVSDQTEGESHNIETRPQYDSFMRVIRR